VPSKDTRHGGANENILRHKLFQSFGNVTRAVDHLFTSTNKNLRNEYANTFAKLPFSHTRYTFIIREELFGLRAVLINMFTQGHKDSLDWKGGMA
jgi:hypothetical protein